MHTDEHGGRILHPNYIQRFGYRPDKIAAQGRLPSGDLVAITAADTVMAGMKTRAGPPAVKDADIMW